ncbi:MAG: hypothetical protein KatS3mg027_0277 [Bacteroidia bacterium]|nr:MAG: hypothetical protein KatS3mg027_0277 [Bacteroidia bacterium]
MIKRILDIKIKGLSLDELIWYLVLLFLLIESNIISWFLAIIFFLWILRGRYKDLIVRMKQGPFLSIFSLYIVYVIGMIYTSNIEYGFQKLETKFGMIIIPILLLSYNDFFVGEGFWRYSKAFVYFVLFVLIFCFLRACYLFGYELYCRHYGIELDEYPYTNYFFSSYLSAFMHYGYFAMYVNVAIILIYSDLLNSSPLRLFSKKSTALLVVVFLSLGVFFLYSKVGMFTNVLIHIYYFLLFVKVTMSWKTLLKSSIVVLILMIILSVVFPENIERFKLVQNVFIEKKTDSTSVESTQLRYYAWKASIQLSKKAFLTGHGTGDVNDLLIEQYRKMNYVGALKKQINSHNQFLQTQIAIGIIGVLLLLCFFISTFLTAIQKKNHSLQIYVIILFIALLFESYLETQAGVIYLSFFTFFLSFYEKDKLA